MGADRGNEEGREGLEGIEGDVMCWLVSEN